MAEEVKAYRYLIPLDTVDGVERPTYDSSPNGEVLFTRYNADTLEQVQTESSPHFHKDSINVQVEEVDATDYGYEPEETEEDGEE